MKTEIIEALKTFRESPERRFLVVERAVEAVGIGTTQAKVRESVGPPDRIRWSYSLFYSSVLAIVFDQEGHLISITTDVTPVAPPGGSAELSDPEVQRAGEDFRAGGNRQGPAAVLLPALQPGAEESDLAPLLGEPDAVTWEYDLEPGTTAALLIAFDPKRQVTAVDF